MNQEIEIGFLEDHQKHIPVLAKLWYEEISRHWNKEASIEKAETRLYEHMNKELLPMAVVALEEGKPIGMACLRETDGIRPGLAPWLGSLVVDPRFRGQKVGTALIEAIKYKAKALGHQTLYLLAFDPTIPEWYTKLGWQLIGQDELLGHPVAVMSISI